MQYTLWTPIPISCSIVHLKLLELTVHCLSVDMQAVAVQHGVLPSTESYTCL